jgi:hypothetical protein
VRTIGYGRRVPPGDSLVFRCASCRTSRCRAGLRTKPKLATVCIMPRPARSNGKPERHLIGEAVIGGYETLQVSPAVALLAALVLHQAHSRQVSDCSIHRRAFKSVGCGGLHYPVGQRTSFSRSSSQSALVDSQGTTAACPLEGRSAVPVPINTYARIMALNR